MNGILWGVGLIVFAFVIGLVRSIIKASKNPDVQAASDLKMTIQNYRKYQKLYDEHWDVMMKYGANSREAEHFFNKSIFPQINNHNEWRRYQNYREELQRKEMMDQITKS